MFEDVISWENLNALVLREFPALLRDDLIEKIGGFEWEPGPYTIFGTMFNQHIRETVRREVDEQSKIGAFLERMAESGVVNIEELLQLEVLPTLVEDQGTLDAYWPYLGTHTRRLISLIAPRVAPSIVLPT